MMADRRQPNSLNQNYCLGQNKTCGEYICTRHALDRCEAADSCRNKNADSRGLPMVTERRRPSSCKKDDAFEPIGPIVSIAIGIKV